MPQDISEFTTSICTDCNDPDSHCPECGECQSNDPLIENECPSCEAILPIDKDHYLNSEQFKKREKELQREIQAGLLNSITDPEFTAHIEYGYSESVMEQIAEGLFEEYGRDPTVQEMNEAMEARL